jgi:hypothetical protein
MYKVLISCQLDVLERCQFFSFHKAYTLYFKSLLPEFKTTIRCFGPLITVFGGLGKSHLATEYSGCSFVVGFAKEGLNVYRPGRKGGNRSLGW